jgi:hypothetical protein
VSKDTARKGIALTNILKPLRRTTVKSKRADGRAPVQSKILWYVFCLILVGAQNCFYFVNADAINIHGVLNYLDFFVLLALGWAGYTWWQDRGEPNPIFRYKWLILATVILSILSSVQAQRLYGQGFITGLRPQRFWVVWGLMYFPLTKHLFLKKLSWRQIRRFIYAICTIELLLYIIQYFLYGKFNFLYVYVNVRYGENRFYYSNLLLCVFLFFNLDELSRFKKKGVLSAAVSGVSVMLVLFVLVVVGKMRMTTLAVLGAGFVGVMLWREGGRMRLILLGAAVLAAVALALTQMGRDTLSALADYLTGNVDKSSTLNIRLIGREWYFAALKAHPILGGGYPSTLDAAASAAAGFDKNIYLVDNGVFGFLFIYGFPGALWVIALFGYLSYDGWRLMRARGWYSFFLIPLYWLIAIQTEMHWYYEQGGFLVMVILLAAMEYGLRGVRKPPAGRRVTE